MNSKFKMKYVNFYCNDCFKLAIFCQLMMCHCIFIFTEYIFIQPLYFGSIPHGLVPSRLGLQNIMTASLQRGKTPTLTSCPGYNTKQSDGEVLVMLELLGM